MKDIIKELKDKKKRNKVVIAVTVDPLNLKRIKKKLNGEVTLSSLIDALLIHFLNDWDEIPQAQHGKKKRN